MPDQVGFRCQDCNHGFVIDVLTPREVEQRRREKLPVGRIHCPQCDSVRVERVRLAA
jgi:Zn finger protein HypA/HybF involved in hydrogenase expression